LIGIAIKQIKINYLYNKDNRYDSEQTTKDNRKRWSLVRIMFNGTNTGSYIENYKKISLQTLIDFFLL